MRNSGSIVFDHDIEEALRDLSGELGKTRNNTVRFIVREWMEKNTYLPCMSWTNTATLMGKPARAAEMIDAHD